ncbi:MAG: hypothetical protein ACHQC8_01645 [Solirubrobacterales bacterium]
MRRLTTLAMVLVLLAGVAGCGGSSNQPAEARYAACLRESAKQFAKGGSVLNCKQPNPSPELQHQECLGKHGADQTVAEMQAAEKACEGVGKPLENHKEVPSREGEHTPEEEAGHNKGLEIQRRGEKEQAEGQKKLEEDETRGGEHSIRRVEEKVCYESGKSSAECKGPLKETPQEERSEAENKARTEVPCPSTSQATRCYE